MYLGFFQGLFSASVLFNSHNNVCAEQEEIEAELHGSGPDCILLQFGAVHFGCIRTTGRKALEKEIYRVKA